MRPSTKAFLVGLLVGALLTVALEVLGLMGLGFLMSTRFARHWVAEAVLRPPHFPDVTSLPDYGAVDYGWVLKTLDGETVPFSDFEDKTVFLNVWATWCAPCVMELPSIENLSRSIDGSAVEMVIVSQEEVDAVRAFVERQPLDLPLYVAEELPDLFKGNTVPATFVIEPGGTLVFKHAGAASWDGESCREFLLSLGG